MLVFGGCIGLTGNTSGLWLISKVKLHHVSLDGWSWSTANAISENTSKAILFQQQHASASNCCLLRRHCVPRNNVYLSEWVHWSGSMSYQSLYTIITGTLRCVDICIGFLKLSHGAQRMMQYDNNDNSKENVDQLSPVVGRMNSSIL